YASSIKVFSSLKRLYIYLSTSYKSSYATLFSAGLKSLTLPSRNLNVLRILRYTSETCFKISSDTRTSSSKSDDITQRRIISAPICCITFVGRITLPRDFDIFLPWPSITNPCDSSSLYGEWPLVATLVISDELNHPRYWSEPSK